MFVYPAAKQTATPTSPSATISGSNTGLTYPIGIALDSSRNIYVANCPHCEV